MINKKKNLDRVLFICGSFFVCSFLLYEIVYIIAVCITRIRFGIPADVREMASVKLVDYFIHGINPYKEVSVDMPYAWYDSGFIHLFFSVVFGRLFGVSSMAATFLPPVIMEILIVCIMIITLYKFTSNLYFSVLAGAINLLCLWRGTYCVSRPDVFCEFCVWISICLLLKNPRNKVNISICAFLACVVFFAKPVYVTYAMTIFLFLLIKDRKIAVLYCACGLGALMVISGIGIVCFPIYFSCFLSGLLFKTVAFMSVSHMYEQWIEFLKLMYPFLVILFTCGLKCFKPVLSSEKKIEWKDVKLYVTSAEGFFATNTILNCIALCYIGQMVGAWLWYYFFTLSHSVLSLTVLMLKRVTVTCKVGTQFYALNSFLIVIGYIANLFLAQHMAFLLIVLCFFVCGLIIVGRGEKTSRVDPKVKVPNGVGVFLSRDKGFAEEIGLCVLCAIVGINAFYQIGCMPHLEYASVNQDKSNWDKAYSTIETYASENIYLSMNTALYGIRNNMYIYDYGDNEYIIPPDELLLEYLGDSSMVQTHLQYWYADLDYKRRIIENIAAKYYSIIVTGWPFPDINMRAEFDEALSGNYEMIDSAFLCGVEAGFWIPKKT